MRFKNSLVLKLCLLSFFHFAICQQKQIKGELVDSVAVNSTVVKKNQRSKVLKYNGADGPYVVNDDLYRINRRNQLIEQYHFKSDSLLVSVDNEFKEEFYVELGTDYGIPKSTYELPDKLVAISDIEGNFNAFAGFLFANKIIDKNHNWIYDNGHLVLVGDFVDRGKNVTQVLWLIYKLERQAKKNGGDVHFILGNHEVLNFQGDYRYTQGKYVKAAQEISGESDATNAIRYMYSDTTELGKWMNTKNYVEKLGGYIFIHGGLSKEILEYELSIDDINNKMHESNNDKFIKRDSVSRFLYGSKGPIWYRGLVIDRRNYKKETAQELEEVLSFYNAEKVVIGHTFVKDISKGFQGKVIMLDVPHGKKKFSGRTKGLLIENGKQFIIDDLGEKESF